MQKNKFLTLIILLGLILGALITNITYQQVKQHLSERITNDVRQLGEKLDAQLARYSKLPEVLANDPRLLSALMVNAPAVDQYQKTSLLLQEWANSLNADTIYLINRSGDTLAASNWQNEGSFIGQNYAYRPYFQDPMAGKLGQYFALGAHSDKRGYYFSAPIYQLQQIIGVLVIKVDLSLVEDIWQYDQIEYAIADQLGVIFYSSEDSWLYRSLVVLNDEQKQQVFSSRQYGQTKLEPLSDLPRLTEFNQQEISNITIPSINQSEAFLIANHNMEQAGWTIYGFSPINTAYQYVVQALFVFTAFYMLLCLAVMSWFQTFTTKKELAQLNDKLEILVIERTRNLMETNQQLRDTIEQYERSQAELKQTQSELVQAAKLAMLGELSASINHEINQPLAAMRTYAENTRKLLQKNRYEAVASNIDEIVNLNQMVSDIISRFKVFARKTTENNNRTVAADSIRSAVSLLRNKLIKHGVVLRLGELPSELLVRADAVQFEQVLVNLLHNAIQALGDSRSPQIGVQLEPLGDMVEIRIWDNGTGLDDDQKKRIFTPFFTTKNEGLGLGLTISRRIIDSFSGSLTIEDHNTGGAEFVITLPRCTEDA
ncbi:sensor histidine kinase [Photobacterium lipolyticum]|uniref:C4-dicarboxylate transport sensor protein DctB n=1 Tax=Photobacterium lipolyticum TaxID=266810 RepID=A0A2T3MWZ4_9GAMM|nr:ATP-binding protein [Photobacterium lipolyticum]PSW04476.1 sensor histidine kinase [Photobacterium lipolyticum]